MVTVRPAACTVAARLEYVIADQGLAACAVPAKPETPNSRTKPPEMQA